MKKLTEKQISSLWKKIEISPNIHILLLDTMSDRNIVGNECNRNIYFCNENYEILWQVQYPRNPFEDEDSGYDGDPFVWMGFDENERKLYANKFRGNEYEIDIKTGVAKVIGWHK